MEDVVSGVVSIKYKEWVLLKFKLGFAEIDNLFNKWALPSRSMSFSGVGVWVVGFVLLGLVFQGACVCVCVSVCMCTCVSVYMYVCLYVCMSIYVYVYGFVCVCICMCFCMSICVCVGVSLYFYMCVCTCVSVYVWCWQRFTPQLAHKLQVLNYWIIYQI